MWKAYTSTLLALPLKSKIKAVMWLVLDLVWRRGQKPHGKASTWSQNVRTVRILKDKIEDTVFPFYNAHSPYAE